MLPPTELPATAIAGTICAKLAGVLGDPLQGCIALLKLGRKFRSWQRSVFDEHADLARADDAPRTGWGPCSPLSEMTEPWGRLPQPKPQEILTSLQNKTPVDMSGVMTVEKTISQDGRTVKLYIMKPEQIRLIASSVSLARTHGSRSQGDRCPARRRRKLLRAIADVAGDRAAERFPAPPCRKRSRWQRPVMLPQAIRDEVGFFQAIRAASVESRCGAVAVG
jgi:hypothetical protein